MSGVDPGFVNNQSKEIIGERFQHEGEGKRCGKTAGMTMWFHAKWVGNDLEKLKRLHLTTDNIRWLSHEQIDWLKDNQSENLASIDIKQAIQNTRNPDVVKALSHSLDRVAVIAFLESYSQAAGIEPLRQFIERCTPEEMFNLGRYVQQNVESLVHVLFTIHPEKAGLFCLGLALQETPQGKLNNNYDELLCAKGEGGLYKSLLESGLKSFLALNTPELKQDPSVLESFNKINLQEFYAINSIGGIIVLELSTLSKANIAALKPGTVQHQVYNAYQEMLKEKSWRTEQDQVFSNRNNNFNAIALHLRTQLNNKEMTPTRALYLLDCLGNHYFEIIPSKRGQTAIGRFIHYGKELLLKSPKEGLQELQEAMTQNISQLGFHPPEEWSNVFEFRAFKLLEYLSDPKKTKEVGQLLNSQSPSLARSFFYMLRHSPGAVQPHRAENIIRNLQGLGNDPAHNSAVGAFHLDQVLQDNLSGLRNMDSKTRESTTGNAVAYIKAKASEWSETEKKEVREELFRLLQDKDFERIASSENYSHIGEALKILFGPQSGEYEEVLAIVATHKVRIQQQNPQQNQQEIAEL